MWLRVRILAAVHDLSKNPKRSSPEPNWLFPESPSAIFSFILIFNNGELRAFLCILLVASKESKLSLYAYHESYELQRFEVNAILCQMVCCVYCLHQPVPRLYKLLPSNFLTYRPFLCASEQIFLMTVAMSIWESSNTARLLHTASKAWRKSIFAACYFLLWRWVVPRTVLKHKDTMNSDEVTTSKRLDAPETVFVFGLC